MGLIEWQNHVIQHVGCEARCWLGPDHGPDIRRHKQQPHSSFLYQSGSSDREHAGYVPARLQRHLLRLNRASDKTYLATNPSPDRPSIRCQALQRDWEARLCDGWFFDYYVAWGFPVLMVGFAPSSKPGTLAHAMERCQIKLHLVHLMPSSHFVRLVCSNLCSKSFL